MSDGQRHFWPRFTAVAEVRGDAPAVEASGRVAYSYRQLHAAAVALATRLQARGVAAESVVALALPKSPQYVVALLAVWAAGGAFLPLDVSLPRRRRRRYLEEAAVAHAVVAPELGSIGDLGEVETHGVAAGPAASDSVLPMPALEDLAYVLYTSGSSGASKGVAVTHRGIVAMLDAQIEAFRLTGASRCLWVLSPLFDASVSDLGTTLLAGATLVLEPARSLRDPVALLALVAERQVTHVDLPPALLPLLDADRAPSCLQTVIVGGEPCALDAVRRWARRVRLVNVYGPTEATVCTSLCRCDPELWQRPVLGRPLPGVRYRILGADGHAVAAGTAGELHIGGTALARGYVGRPQLTAERFVERAGERLFRTGDRVVEHADGELEFLGRLDRQLKLAGRLVAPEEIETQLRSHRDVAQAAVIAVPTGAAKRPRLVAWVVARRQDVDAARLQAELRNHLEKSLPPWMIPRRFRLLDALPSGGSGKVDLAALASLAGEAGEDGSDGTAARSQLERLLAELWCAVLGVSSCALGDDFFALGGDSLAVVELVARAEERGLALTPGMVVEHPRLGELAERLQTQPALLLAERMAAAQLRRDVELDGAWRRCLQRAARRPRQRRSQPAPRRVLLTGGTGFLGSRLLRELLRRCEAKVYCLVRGDDVERARRRLLATVSAPEGRDRLQADEAARIEVVCGDLRRPRFALDTDRWHRLAAEVEAIYHCAAEVNLVLPYRRLRPTNVEGTLEVARLFCDGRRKALHYASTLSVFVSTERNEGVAREDDDLAATRWVWGGYAQSKWAAEVLLRQVATAARGPLALYRFGLLTGDSRTGEAPAGDWLARFCRGLAEIGSVPGDIDPELTVDITPVDYAAAAMAHLSLTATTDEDLRAFHLASRRGARLTELVAALRSNGVPLTETPGIAWRAHVRERLAAALGGDEAAAWLALCRAFGEISFARQRAFDLFQATRIRFDDRRARAGLAGSGIACPPADAALLRLYARRSLRQREAAGV